MASPGVLVGPKDACNARGVRSWLFENWGPPLLLGLVACSARPRASVPVKPTTDASSIQAEQALAAPLLERASGSERWKGEEALSEPPLASRPELLAQRLSLAEVLEDVKNDPRALDPIIALIYARRGRMFKSPRWNKFAAGQGFYHPDPDYKDNKLTTIDRENLALLSQIRNRIDRRGPRAPADAASLVARSAFPGCPADAALKRTADERGILTYACEQASPGPTTGHVQHGPTWRWLPTGRLLEMRNYDAGREHGPFVAWFWTGVRREDGEFVQGQRQSRHRMYHPTGAIAEDATYNQGRLDGTRRRGFDDGKAALEATYSNGIPHGIWTTFYDNGQRALVMTFRNGKVIGSVQGFSLDGKPWPAGALHEACRYSCASELGHLDLESLPPIPPEPCRQGVVGTANAWPRSVIRPLVRASRKAIDETVGCSPANCADSVAISCAPDLDGKPGGEILAVIACRVPLPCPDCGADANREYAALAANVILSPPAPGRPSWIEHGFVSCRENSSFEGDPQSKVQGYLRLPDGEVAISTLHSAASSDDGRERCSQSLYSLRQGKWQEVMSGESQLCAEEGLPEEPEEFDVY